MQDSPDVIIAGHSHTFAMGAPRAYQGPIDLAPLPDRPDIAFVLREWGTPEEDFWKAVVEYSRNRTVLLSYKGSQHDRGFLFSTPFDFIDSHTTTLEEGVPLVPRSMILSHFRQDCAELEGLVRQLHEVGAKKVAILGTPAVKPDTAALLEQLKRMQEKRGWNRELKPLPCHIRLKLWRVLQHVMEEVAQRSGALFVPSPPKSLDENGFLRKEFWEDDVMHANERYGQWMLDLALKAVQ